MDCIIYKNFPETETKQEILAIVIPLHKKFIRIDPIYNYWLDL